MPNTMNATNRAVVVKVAKRHGFLLQTKETGEDLYVKNMVFRHTGGQTVYVRKDVGINMAGEASSYTVAIHPDYFSRALDSPGAGFERKRNRRTGNYLFSSSNYLGFPRYPGLGEPCANCIEAKNSVGLDKLFAALADTIPSHIDRASRLAKASETSSGQVLDQGAIGPGRAPVVGRSKHNLLSGLIIREEPLEQILRGEKDWEMRRTKVQKRGRIALIIKGSGQVVGVATLVDCRGPFSDEQMLNHYEHHRIPRELLRDGEVAAWRTAWVLADVRRLDTPVPYSHPSGAVIWVSLNDAVSGAIMRQLDITHD